MKISVIVPTYKPQDYLWECLDSIYNQNFPKEEYELLLVLNGCSEPYNTQIGKWLSGHSDMKVNFIQTDVGGVSNARNIALDNAKGLYVTFIDDDDFVSPDYLKELYKKATPDTIALCYPYAFRDGDLKKQLPYALTRKYEQVACNGKLSYTRARKYFSGPCMKLIPMIFIQDRRYDSRFKNGEDSLFMFLISDKFNKISFTSPKFRGGAIYYRRYRSNSAVTSKRSRIDIINNSWRIIKEYIIVYFRHPLSYNMNFFFTRILAAFHAMIK